jgi:hypothetical protein
MAQVAPSTPQKAMVRRYGVVMNVRNVAQLKHFD